MAVPRAMREGDRCRAIAAELSVIRLDGAGVFDSVLPEIRAAMDVESMLIFAPALRVEGWEIARYQGDGFANNAKLKQLLTQFLAHAPVRFAWYDPTQPEREQRNRVIEPFVELSSASACASRASRC